MRSGLSYEYFPFYRRVRSNKVARKAQKLPPAFTYINIVWRKVNTNPVVS
jgi:hypothetical protein